MAYLESKNVNVYPSAYRGVIEISDEQYVYDPESRLTTEENTVRILKEVGSYQNGWVITKDWDSSTAGDDDPFEFIIGGYFFRIRHPKEVFKTESNYYAHILLEDKGRSITSDENNINYKATSLKSNAASGTNTSDEECLDTLMEDTKVYFTGVVIDGNSSNDGYTYTLKLVNKSSNKYEVPVSSKIKLTLNDIYGGESGTSLATDLKTSNITAFKATIGSTDSTLAQNGGIKTNYIVGMSDSSGVEGLNLVSGRHYTNSVENSTGVVRKTISWKISAESTHNVLEGIIFNTTGAVPFLNVTSNTPIYYKGSNVFFDDDTNVYLKNLLPKTDDACLGSDDDCFDTVYSNEIVTHQLRYPLSGNASAELTLDNTSMLISKTSLRLIASSDLDDRQQEKAEITLVADTPTTSGYIETYGNINASNGNYSFNGKTTLTAANSTSDALIVTLGKTSLQALSATSYDGVIINNKAITNVTSLTASGQIQAGSFYATSDATLKENITSFDYKKSILDLDVKEYNFIGSKEKQIGCLAQDLQKLYPELVKKDVDGKLSIQETKLTYLLLEEVKSLRKELNELKRK